MIDEGVGLHVFLWSREKDDEPRKYLSLSRCCLRHAARVNRSVVDVSKFVFVPVVPCMYLHTNSNVGQRCTILIFAPFPLSVSPCTPARPGSVPHPRHFDDHFLHRCPRPTLTTSLLRWPGRRLLRLPRTPPSLRCSTLCNKCKRLRCTKPTSSKG